MSEPPTEAHIELSQKIIKICHLLRASQSLEYDPVVSQITIRTDWAFPANEFARVAEIISGSKADEALLIQRFAARYKVSLLKRFAV
jgi:hypothetical protein